MARNMVEESIIIIQEVNSEVSGVRIRSMGTE
jgi:hypothetical protein